MNTVSGLGGWIVTVATGSVVTVTDVVPDLPSLVAVIVAVPPATPVTTPDDDTTATAVAPDAQVTTRFVTITPLTSRTVALNCTFAPTKIPGPCGCTVTEPTATCEIVSAALPFFPSLVAVIDVLPAATAVTTPCDDTVATPVF